MRPNNPVNHGWVSRPVDWPHSTLHGYIERGMLTPDWRVPADDGVNGYDERGDVGLHFNLPNLRGLVALLLK
jgi:hypothetical protein